MVVLSLDAAFACPTQKENMPKLNLDSNALEMQLSVKRNFNW